MRLKTLHLIEVVLQRASETAATLRTHQTPSSPPPLSLTATSYTDSVLKVLPELKTLVNLWQGLQRRSGAGSREYLEQARSSGDTLSLEHRLANTSEPLLTTDGVIEPTDASSSVFFPCLFVEKHTHS